MGWLDKLVKPAIKQGDKMEYVDPEQIGEALAKAAAATAQPSTADVQGNISEPYMAQGETMSPGPMSTPQPDAPEMVQPPDQMTTSYSTPPAAPQPSIVHPSLEQASTDANGLPAASTPGLTRLGKLFQILGMAAKGGLAGRAASERAVAESGGHRGGGIGQGFEAGLTEAPREATMQQGVERGAMENAAQKANLSALPWMRAMQQQKAVADLAESQGKAVAAPYVTPRGGGVFDARTGKYAPGAQPTEKQVNQSPQQVYADAVKDAMDRGLTGPALMQDPKVQGALGAVQAAQKEPKPDNLDQQYLDAASKGDSATMANIEKAWKVKASNTHITVNPVTTSDIKDIADAIENGDQPPTLQGLYRNGAPVRAELARRGVPLAKMEMDWNATKKYVATLNGPQQVRLRQAISSASDMADKIDDLYKQYHDVVGDAGMKAFNKAGLIAAQNLPGKAGALAHALVAQISDLTADLGNVYMGGNSPTDHALQLAGKNLSADWNRETFEEGIKQVHANIKIRQNSINHAMPAGVSGDSTYFTAPADSPATTPTDIGKTQRSGSQIVVTDPTDGTQYRFPDQKSADAYKKAAGIQ